MKKILFLLVLSFISNNLFSQKGKYVEVEMITHQVKMGETIRTISQKYLVEPGEIYQFNKYAVNGIKQGMTLLIPVPVKDPIVANEVKIKPKKVEAPTEKNIEVKSIEVIKPKVQPIVTDISNSTEHKVEPKETLYSLSRKFNISVDELKLANPTLENTGVQIGMMLKIPSKRVLADNETSIGSPKPPVATSKVLEVNQKAINHTVVAKETFYSLSKKYNVSAEEIQKQNESVLSNGLQIGLILTIKK